MAKMWKVFSRWGLLAALVGGSGAHAAYYQITVNTPSFVNTSALLAFDLLTADPLNIYSVEIFEFAPTGALGTSITKTTGVTGTLADVVTLPDTEGFNEYMQDITLESSLSFKFRILGTVVPPLSFPDAFSLLVLDVNGFPLFDSSDPTENNVVFTFNIGNDDPLEVYRPFSDDVTVTDTLFPENGGVPEPGVLVLIMAGLLALGVVRLARNQQLRWETTD